jgi:hypothetical protein
MSATVVSWIAYPFGAGVPNYGNASGASLPRHCEAYSDRTLDDFAALAGTQSTEKLVPQPQADLAFGFFTAK